MADRIRVTGPVRDWVEEERDEDGNLVGGGFWQKMIFVEATGTDGIVYGKSYAFGDNIDKEFIPAFIDGGKLILRNSMEELDVW